MTMRSVKKNTLLLFLALILTGCKLTVIATSGGDTTSLSGTRNCSGPNVCEFEVTNSDFNETFTAIARPGFEFQQWSDGPGFMCGGSTDPACTVELPPEPWASAIVALFDIGYVMPIFKDVGIDTDGDGIRNELDDDDDNDGILDIHDTCPLDPSPTCSSGVPLTDTVVIDGREWAQVDLFTSLSWNDMNAVCQGGPCSGVLNGFNMVGWTWATRAEVQELFEHYICEPTNSGCLFGGRSEINSSWAPALFADGMRPTFETSTYRLIRALVNDNEADPSFRSWTFWIDRLPIAEGDSAFLANVGSEGIDTGSTLLGGWFYRSP